MQVPVRTTVVGCGAVASGLYREPLARLEKQKLVEVVALVDCEPAHTESLRASFRNARSYTDVTTALLQGGSELTLVLSPPRFHAIHTLTALRHRNHVLCEKPMAVTEAQALDMTQAARRAKRILAVGMIRRFFPAFAILKDWIERDELGELQSFAYREGKVFDWDVTTPAGFTKTVEGGSGVLLDLGAHAIDYLISLFGMPRVLSYSDDALDGVEANVVMYLQFLSCTGIVQLSWDSPLRNELRVIGSKAQAVLRLDELDRIAIRKMNGFEEVEAAHEFAAEVKRFAREMVCPRLYPEAIYAQLIQTLRAIQLGEEPAVNGEAGLACLRVIEAARRMAEPLPMPWLHPRDQQAHAQFHWTNA